MFESYNYGEYMKELEEMIDDLSMAIYEISSINKCIRDTLQCYVNSHGDYSHLLPIANIACSRLEKLTDDYSELESKIYKRILNL